MGVNFQLVIVLWLAWNSSSLALEWKNSPNFALFRANDCTYPQGLRDVFLEQLPCVGVSAKIKSVRNITVQVVQKQIKERMVGYWCKAVRHERNYYCGKSSIGNFDIMMIIN